MARPTTMKVLFLAPQPLYQLRGTCIALRRCLEELSASGREVDVLTFPYGEDLVLPGVRFLRLPRLPFARGVPIGPSRRKAVLDVLLFVRAFLLCLAHRYDVVHASEESVFAAALLKPLFGFRLVYDMDDVLSARLARSGFVRRAGLLRLIAAAERRAIRACDVVLTNSADTTAYAESLAPAGRVVFYDHAPPLPPGGPLSAERRKDFREACGAGEGKLIVYAGNLEPYQGVSLLLESLPHVLSAAPATTCALIGGEAAQIESLRRKADGLGVGERVRWLGKKPIDEAFACMRAADVVVSPMTQEKAVPMKAYAYLASGTAIVATDLPNHAQVFDRGAAVLVPPRREELARGLLQALAERAPARPRAPVLRHVDAAMSEAYALLAP